MKTAAELLAGRKRHEPQRDSDIYPRLMNLGGWQRDNKRPLIKPTPANLRMFGKTTYPRRAMNRIKLPIETLEWEVRPKVGIELNSTLQKQIDVATLCLQQPNRLDNFRSFTGKSLEDMMTNGACAYEHALGGDKSRPLWMWPVDSMSIQIDPDWNGKDSEPRYYQTLGYGNIGGVQGKALLDSEIVYGVQNPTNESPFGLGELEVAFAAINRTLGVADYAGKLASNAQPENLLVMPGWTNEQLLAYRQYWRNEIEGQGQTPIVSPPVGSKAEMLKLRGTDDATLFIGYQELLIREISTAWNINPMSLGLHGDVNRATAEVIDDADWENAVVPKATLYASFITSTIESKLGFSQLEFGFKGLKRDDKLAEAQIYQIEFENGAATPNEYRARNNMPPSDGPWGDLTGPDVEIAKAAARGAAQVDDPALKQSPKSKPKPKGK